MFITLYLRTKENEEIVRLAEAAGLSKSKYMVMKALEKSNLLNTLFRPRKSN